MARGRGRSFASDCQPSPRLRQRFRARTLLLVTMVIGLTTGCGTSTLHPRTSDFEVGSRASSLEEYLQLAVGIDRQDAEGLRSYSAQAREEYRAKKTVDNRLRLALVLSAPGRSSADMAEAARLLSDLATEWEPRRRGLAQLIALRCSQLDERIRAAEEVGMLQERAGSLQRENDKITRERKDTVAELERVRAALAEAETKIDALMSIERSIERPAGGEASSGEKAR